MMREFSPQRRKVIALCCALTSMSGLCGAIGVRHRWIAGAAIGVGLLLLVYILREFVVLKRQESGVRLRLDE
jgi:hypothetical protein